MNPTILYILYHEDLHAIKIGISDITGKRYKQHKSKGWSLVAYWHFFERDRARHIEFLVLKTLRKKHGIYLSKEDMPQSGYTETFDANKVKKKQVIRLVNKYLKSQEPHA